MDLAAHRNKYAAVRAFLDLKVLSKEPQSQLIQDNEIQSVLPLAVHKDMQAKSKSSSASHIVSTVKMNVDRPSGSIKKRQAHYTVLCDLLFRPITRGLPTDM